MDGLNSRSEPSQGYSIAGALFQADFGDCFICFSDRLLKTPRNTRASEDLPYFAAQFAAHLGGYFV
jgi:hypothetical protein